MPANTPPWPFLAAAYATAVGDACNKQNEKTAKACDPMGKSRKEKCKPTEKERGDFKQAGKDKNRIKNAEMARIKADRASSHLAPLSDSKLEEASKGTQAYKDALKAWNDGAEKMADAVAADDCSKHLRCYLHPYKPSQCCPGQTGHHLVEASAFVNSRGDKDKMVRVAGIGKYEPDKAPCICVEGENQNQGTHGLMHTYQSTAAGYTRNGGQLIEKSPGTIAMADGTTYNGITSTYGDAKEDGVKAVKKAFPESPCDPGCLIAQLDAYHNEVGLDDKTPCKAVVTGGHGQKAQTNANQSVKSRSARLSAGKKSLKTKK